jgi:hypothetical protein
MRRALAGVSVLLFFTISAMAQESIEREPRFEQARHSSEYLELVDPGLRGLYEEAAVDTYCLVWYTFETRNWQGWTRYDLTNQGTARFWHVDDFAGLNGGTNGGLVPLEGTKSFWCGARPNPADPYLCLWQNAPGYGNRWNQTLITRYCCCLTYPALPRFGPITFAYKIAYDVEMDHDFVVVEYDAHCEDWRELASYTGQGSTTAVHYIPGNFNSTKLRFRFTSDDAGSDEDGLVDTDGACIVDSLCVSDSVGIVYFENCESAPVGQTSSGIWYGRYPAGAYGGYSGLRSDLRDKDPCGENLSSQIIFFLGSPIASTSYPGLYDTPFCYNSHEYLEPLCQDEIVISPVIDMRKYSTACNNAQNGTIPSGELASLRGAILRYTVYADLPLENLVFYRWAVRSIENGRAGRWMNRDLLYWSDDKDYLYRTENVSDLISSDSIQVALGVVDMCGVWYGGSASCTVHTPAPWFDNVRLYRYATIGPQWSYRDMDLFQDNFASTDSVGGFIRADMAQDINPAGNPSIRPGDSIVVRCTSPVGGGVAVDPGGGPAVYMHVKCTSIGYPAKPSLAGPQLQGTYGRYVSDDGAWTIIQGDTARIGLAVYPDYYMFDLNDALFTYGYMIEYYFAAYDNAGSNTALPRGADNFSTESPYRGSSYYFEFTCLPTMTSGELYVDDFDGIGSFDGAAQSYFDRTFKDVLCPSCAPDRYDVKAPSSLVSNSLASRARPSHLRAAYNLIVWDSGDLSVGTICDGAAGGDKSDDCGLLVDWMNTIDASWAYHPGLWVLGDNVAADLAARPSPQSQELLGTWCGVALKSGSYFDLTGGPGGSGIVSPLVTGVSATFTHAGAPDGFYAFGGCPAINDFDVLEKTVTGQYALKYPDYGGEAQYAAIQAERINSAGKLTRAMWFGFSWMNIRDDVPGAPVDRNEIYRDVTRGWLHGAFVGPNITAGGAPPAYGLAQNFPNPFNPSTTIRFSMKAKGLVTVRIYDVSGRLVRALVEEVRDAGSHAVVWNGTNDLGAKAASGIYFYRMETEGFAATKKLVLLR